MDAAAELQLHPVLVACVILFVAAQVNWAILSINLPDAHRAAEGGLEMVLRSTTAAAAALTGSFIGSRLSPFIVLCFAMGAALHAQPFVTAAAEPHLHQGVAVCVVLAVAALFYWAIFSVHFFVAHTERVVPDVLLGTACTARTAPTSSASRLPLQHFIVLCLGMAALLHVELLVDAATMIHIHPSIVVSFALAVTSLFNWAILSLNIHTARRAEERENKMMPRPAAPAASAARSPRAAHLAFLVLAALVSASWFVEPFAAAAELWLPNSVIVVFVLLFGALFNVSTHLFRSSFLPCTPSAGAAAGQGQGVGAITAGVMGIGIAIAVCLIGAGGSTRFVFAPARR